jgi:hypothetical protein
MKAQAGWQMLPEPYARIDGRLPMQQQVPDCDECHNRFGTVAQPLETRMACKLAVVRYPMIS